MAAKGEQLSKQQKAVVAQLGEQDVIRALALADEGADISQNIDERLAAIDQVLGLADGDIIAIEDDIAIAYRELVDKHSGTLTVAGLKTNYEEKLAGTYIKVGNLLKVAGLTVSTIPTDEELEKTVSEDDFRSFIAPDC